MAISVITIDDPVPTIITVNQGQKGDPGEMSGPLSATDGNIPTFNGTDGTVLRDSGYAPSDFEAAGAIASHAATTTGVHGIAAFGASLVGGANAAAARSTLGLGDAATKNVGTTAGTVAAGDDPRLVAGSGDVTGPSGATDSSFAAFDGTTGKLIKDSAKSASSFETAGAAAALAGTLGTAATKNVGTTAGTVAAGDDSRLSDARTPTAHASTHTSGADDIQSATAAQKGLMTAAYAGKLDNIEAQADVTDAGNVGSSIHGATAKTTPVDTDEVPLIDSEAGNVLKKAFWSSIKATLKTYFDTLYNLYTHPNHSGDVTSTGDGATVIANKTGTDTSIVTGTKGTAGNLMAWNADGDAVDSSSKPADFASAGHNHDLTYLGISATAADVNPAGTSIAGALSGKAASDHNHDLSYLGISATAADVNPAGTSIASALSGKAATNQKLDDFGTPDDNTDLDASTARHGLLPKLGGGTSNFLRADGTWASAGLTHVAETLHTASPNDTVNALQLAVTGGTTNTSLVLTPKGTGALIAGPPPDGTAVGGNVRGANAVDFQSSRGYAVQVASGANSVALGSNNIATGSASVAAGEGCTSANYATIALGYYSQAYDNWGVAIGQTCVTAGHGAVAIGRYNNATWYGTALGSYATARRNYDFAVAQNPFAVAGDNQRVWFCGNATTTDATPTLTSLAPVLAANSCMYFTVRVIGVNSTRTKYAHYWRSGAIKNVSGTTSLISAVETIGTDYEDDANTAVAVTANDTTDALDVHVTGIAGETWYWQIFIDSGELVK